MPNFCLKNGRALIALVAVCLFPLCSLGQKTTASVSGTVVDSVGAIVPGARILVDPLPIQAVTNAQGSFTLPAVPVGKYTLVVSYIGFATLTPPLEVVAGQSLDNLQLALRLVRPASRSWWRPTGRTAMPRPSTRPAPPTTLSRSSRRK